MQTNPTTLYQQINEFKKSITGDPQKMVEQMIQSGQINQAQLNEAQKKASEIVKMFSR